MALCPHPGPNRSRDRPFLLAGVTLPAEGISGLAHARIARTVTCRSGPRYPRRTFYWRSSHMSTEGAHLRADRVRYSRASWSRALEHSPFQDFCS